MMDPFRGEMTARYIQSENLEWAARERLLRQARPLADERKVRRSGVEALVERLFHWHRVSRARTPRQEAN